MSHQRRRPHLLAAVALPLAMAAAATVALVAQPPARGARILVLGTAQDGGVPHAACSCTRCLAARREPERRRSVSSLAVVTEKRTFLVDATPDVREQLEELRLATERGRAEVGGVDRQPLGGVLLTHAHIGHYLGLAFFGFEAVHTRHMPVFATQRMIDFLRRNDPWRELLRRGNIALYIAPPGAPFELADGVMVTPIAAPHRDELSDTVGYLFRGPRASLLYVPDTDAWEGWRPAISELARGVDYALLDGTFYSPAELPGRDVTKIGHPLITRTMDLLGPLVAGGKPRVFFTHLNHSNPALETDSAARREIERRGFRVLDEAQEFPL
jgi:pyrroloquinoline quinone biosynthesis protein B